MRFRRAALTNPATWYLTFGLVALAGSMWAPYATALRTTRIESRGDEIASALIAAVRQWPDVIAPADVPVLLARFYALAERDGAFLGDLEVVEPPWSGTLLSLQNKHYLFQVAESPPPVDDPGTPGSVPAYEVMAWPRRRSGPAHSVFFHPANALAAYTRNLAQGYDGAGRDRPQPGAAQRRQALWEWTKSYYGQDDERWIVHNDR
ncbi:MAG: hypothetical protein KDE27_30675 [Planctomycetes bacterium]|nr:hypothetical protein [Planctomycetota bacterium]